MRTRTMRMTAGALVAVVAMFAAACSDDTDSADDTSDQTSTTAADMTNDDMANDDTSDDAAEQDLVDTAVAAGDFTTLVAAVQAAGLEETLRGEGPFTVFAPADAAFEALPAGTVDTLLEDPTGQLADILTYHVVEGAVLAADVAGLDGQEVTTVNGATFTVTVGDDGSVSLTDAAGNTIGVVQTDIETSNGVIHVIDAVMMPA